MVEDRHTFKFVFSILKGRQVCVHHNESELSFSKGECRSFEYLWLNGPIKQKEEWGLTTET